MGDSVRFQQKGQMAVDQGFTGSCPSRGFRGGGVGTSPLLCLRLKPGQSPGQPVLGRMLKGTELGKITHAPHAIHNCACTCVIGDTSSTAGFIIIQQEDVAYCQEQILLDTWVIVRDWGVGGEESPWLQGGREHVGQENGPGPGPEPVPRGSSHCAPLGARPVTGKKAEAPGGRLLGTWKIPGLRIKTLVGQIPGPQAPRSHVLAVCPWAGPILPCVSLSSSQETPHVPRPFQL